MAISREKKHEIMAEYGQHLARSQAVILTDYRGMTVANMTDLRGKLREVGAAFQVVKNTLFERSLIEAGVPVAEGQLQGPIAVGYCFGDVPAVTKVLLDCAKETEMLRIVGAFFGTSYLDAEGAKALATLPPRPVVLAQLLGSVQGPMTGLASIVTAPLRELIHVLQARSEQVRQEAA